MVGRVDSPRMFHVKPWRCSTAQRPQVRTPGPIQDVSRETAAMFLRRGAHRAGCLDVPDASRGTRRRWSAARPHALKPHGSPGMADRTGAPRLTPTGSNTQTDRFTPGPAAVFRCSTRRPGMPGCFTWNPEAVSRGRYSSIRTPTAPPGFTGSAPVFSCCRPADPDARTGRMFHVEPCRCSTGRVHQSRTPDRARMFHVERERCST